LSIASVTSTSHVRAPTMLVLLMVGNKKLQNFDDLWCNDHREFHDTHSSVDTRHIKRRHVGWTWWWLVQGSASICMTEATTHDHSLLILSQSLFYLRFIISLFLFLFFFFLYSSFLSLSLSSLLLYPFPFLFCIILTHSFIFLFFLSLSVCLPHSRSRSGSINPSARWYTSWHGLHLPKCSGTERWYVHSCKFSASINRSCVGCATVVAVLRSASDWFISLH